jgi:hypothetical protein
VWSAIDQLGRDHLLQYCVAKQSSSPRMTRRQQLRSLGRAAAIAGPIVASLALPQRAAASCVTKGNPCNTTTLLCCTGLICNGANKCQ